MYLTTAKEFLNSVKYITFWVLEISQDAKLTVAIIFSLLQKMFIFKKHKLVLYIPFCLFSVILALYLGQHINCLINFSFACLYQKLLNFSIAEHVSNFWYFAIIRTFARKYKKKCSSGCNFLVFWHVEKGGAKGMGQKQSQGQKWNHAESLLYFGVIYFPRQ